MKETLSIQEIVTTLKKHVWFIVILTFLLVSVAFIVSYFVFTPKYQSTSQFIVIQQPSENNPFTVNEIETSLELMNTYKEIVNSPSILEKVIEELQLVLTPEQLRKQIHVTNSENSQVITVSAVASSPDFAADLANLVVEKFQETIISIMRIENVYVLSKANALLSQKPIQPRPIINMVIAAIIGMTTGIGLSLLIEFLNTKVKTESDLEEIGITVLGTISIIEKQKSRKENKPKASEEGSYHGEEE